MHETDIIELLASVAELVDALDLGSSALCIGVRVPSLAPKSGMETYRFYYAK